jgi:hypothetical protein
LVWRWFVEAQESSLPGTFEVSFKQNKSIVFTKFLLRRKMGVFLTQILYDDYVGRYLYNVLSKNQTVSENNRGLLVETLRSIAEILIWGDQNDGSVFE